MFSRTKCLSTGSPAKTEGRQEFNQGFFAPNQNKQTNTLLLTAKL